MNKVFRYKGIDCRVVPTFYDNGQAGLFIVAAGTPRSVEQGYFEGQPIGSATIQVGIPLLQHQTVLNLRSNPQLVGVLVRQGICTEPNHIRINGPAGQLGAVVDLTI